MCNKEMTKGLAIESALQKGVVEMPIPTPGAGQVLVQMAAVGICGSDLHYYNEGRVGNFQIREPFTPGHEASGYIAALGEGVEGLEVGQPIAINPSKTCGTCEFCRDGSRHLCSNNGFMGSASRFPHSQGMMRGYFVAEEFQCKPVPAELDIRLATMAEPFSVALHAVSRAGSPMGKRVLVVGGGTIGLLVAVGAKVGGAKEVVLSDPSEYARNTAKALGIDVVIDGFLPLEEKQKQAGVIDIAFEAAGVEPALADCLELVRRAGVVVQVGTVPTLTGRANLNLAMNKELDYKGSFRFDGEYDYALHLIATGKVDLMPMISGSFPLEEAAEAFALASDSTRSTKVMVTA
ncbi:L-idonate 5-dehydrogenase [Pseudovibrio flavus]|uniref:L-idonate 5-dehydrogenase n=1 Tax=Pseudovibrio flavus TaxID=2529854 RepID=UPI00211CC217|nr:L-idonate 5-dehydrogenase [Pseudovibrio flavus]